MSNTSTVINHFGALRCDRCGNPIKNVAYALPNDEDHIYCTKCRAVLAREAEHIKSIDEVKP